MRHESELTWIANLATDTILQLRNNNRLDRLQIELYVTNSNENIKNFKENQEKTHLVVLKNDGNIINIINNDEDFLDRRNILHREKKIYNLSEIKVDRELEKNYAVDERKCLLTPVNKRNGSGESNNVNKLENINDCEFEIAKKYPLLACRVRRGRPHWDRVFGYWAHLYPGYVCLISAVLKQYV